MNYDAIFNNKEMIRIDQTLKSLEKFSKDGLISEIDYATIVDPLTVRSCVLMAKRAEQAFEFFVEKIQNVEEYQVCKFFDRNIMIDPKIGLGEISKESLQFLRDVDKFVIFDGELKKPAYFEFKGQKEGILEFELYTEKGFKWDRGAFYHRVESSMRNIIYRLQNGYDTIYNLERENGGN